MLQNDSSAGLLEDEGDPNQLIAGTSTRIFIDGVLRATDTATGTTYTVANIETYDASGVNVDGAYLMFFPDQGAAPATIDMADAIQMPSGATIQMIPDSWTTAPTVLNPLNYIVKGTDGDDVIDNLYRGDPEGDRVDDTITASNDDEIHAGAGNDTINSLVGDDTVYAGTGDDVIIAGEGNDVFYGEAGNDTIGGGAKVTTTSKAGSAMTPSKVAARTIRFMAAKGMITFTGKAKMT